MRCNQGCHICFLQWKTMPPCEIYVSAVVNTTCAPYVSSLWKTTHSVKNMTHEIYAAGTGVTSVYSPWKTIPVKATAATTMCLYISSPWKTFTLPWKTIPACLKFIPLAATLCPICIRFPCPWNPHPLNFLLLLLCVCCWCVVC